MDPVEIITGDCRRTRAPGAPPNAYAMSQRK
jgi:hypothetical protein